MLCPSAGMGGGIERYVDNVEASLRELQISVDRRNVYGASGPNALAKATFPLRTLASRSPSAVWAMHPNLFGLAQWIGRARRVPWIGWVYGAEVFRPVDARTVVGRAASARGLVTISNYTASALLDGGLADRGTLTIVPPVLSDKWWALANRHPRAESPRPRIVAITRVDREAAGKGLGTLLDLAERLKASGLDCETVIVGGGSKLNQYRDIVARRSLTSVCRFVGPVDDETMASELSRGWLFALPSRLEPDNFFGEGFGIVYIEAASLGLPVVGSTDAGAAEAVRDGTTGILVDPRDLDALESTVRRLIAHADLRRTLGLAGLRWAREEFTVARMQRQLEALIGQLIGEAV